MKKIPRDSNWHYLKWLGIFVASILLVGIVINLDRSLSFFSFLFTAISPVILGLLIAMILNIPVKFFERRVFKKLTLKNGPIWSKIKRGVSVSISLLAFLLIISVVLFIIVPEFMKTCDRFISKAPSYMDSFNATLRELVVKLNLPIEPESINISWNAVANWLTSFFGNNSNDIFHSVVNTAVTVFTSIWNLCIGFILAIYIVASKEKLKNTAKAFLYSITNKNKADSIISVLNLTKNSFEDFISGQCLDIICLGTLTFLGMSLFRFPHAAMISCIIAVSAFVPIFGTIVGCIVGALIIMLVNPLQAIWFLIFIIFIQQIEANVIYPKIIGHKIGLPAFWVILSVVICGGLFGILGILVGIPVCSVLYTLLNQWILKRLREKRLCREKATSIPEEISPLSEEEFVSDPPTKEEPAKSKKVKKQKKNKK